MVLQWRERQEERRRAAEAEAAETRRRQGERRRIELEERQLVNKMKLDLHKCGGGKGRARDVGLACIRGESAESGEARSTLSHTHMPSPHSPHIPRQVKERLYHQKRLQAEALAEGKVGVEEDPVQVGVEGVWRTMA